MTDARPICTSARGYRPGKTHRVRVPQNVSKQSVFHSENVSRIATGSAGIIAEYTIAVLISVVSVAIFFRNYSERYPDGSGWYGFAQFLIILIASFVVGQFVWRALGVYLRDRVRYVVRNIWILVGTIVLVLYLLSLVVAVVTS